MSKQSANRIRRYRGYSRLKLAFGIFVVLPICLWLVYEAAHGSWMAGNSKVEALDDGLDEYLMMNLGRKNLNPNPRFISEDPQKLRDEEEIALAEEEVIKVEDEVQEKGDPEGEGEQLEDLIDEDDSED